MLLLVNIFTILTTSSAVRQDVTGRPEYELTDGIQRVTRPDTWNRPNWDWVPPPPLHGSIRVPEFANWPPPLSPEVAREELLAAQARYLAEQELLSIREETTCTI